MSETYKNIEMQVLGESGYETIYPIVTTVLEQNNNLQQKFWRGTQAEYDAIQNKDANTMYIVLDSTGELLLNGDMQKSVYDTENRNTDIFKYVDEHQYDGYTKTETDTLLANKADSNHTHTPASIGAAEALHDHSCLYIASGNEMNLDYGFTGGSIYFNYRGASAAITDYNFSDGLGHTIASLSELAKRTYSTSDITAGSSTLASGTLYLVYE